MKSYTARTGEVRRAWYVVDAQDKVLGRLASRIAMVLRGKTKPTFTPHIDTGHHVVVVNAENSAAGYGVTASTAQELFAAGADIVQLDEPYLQARPAEAAQYGVKVINLSVGGPDPFGQEPSYAHFMNKRLREFLDVSGDVNFEAELAPNDDRHRFAEPQYEQKSSAWKLCYRAGKEAVSAARTFATAWLGELERK